MSRINVTTWQDGRTITKLQGELAIALMEYQTHAAPREDGLWGVGYLYGDSNVMVAAINLRNRLDALIERSRNANTKNSG